MCTKQPVVGSLLGARAVAHFSPTLWLEGDSAIGSFM